MGFECKLSLFIFLLLCYYTIINLFPYDDIQDPACEGQVIVLNNQHMFLLEPY